MLTPRDRLLAGLFAFQLAAAAVFGGVLVHGLNNDEPSSTLVSGELPPGTEVLPGETLAPGATVGPSLPPGASIGPQATTGAGGGTLAPLPAATGAAAAPVKAGAPIKIGVIVTQTGAINFAPSAQGTKAYIDRVNAQGGVNGHKIELTIMDDQLDQARGLAAAQRMLADGAFAFAAWNAPNTENAIVPFLERNKIPLIGSYGEYPQYHSQYAYAFSTAYSHWGYEMARYQKKLGVKNPGLIYITNGEAKADAGLVRGFRNGWKSAGGGDIPNGNFFAEQPTQPTYDDVVTSLQLSRVDGISTFLDQTAYNRLQQAQDRHAYRPIHIATPLFPDPAVTKTSRNEGTYVGTDVDFLDTGGPAVQDYVKTIKAQYGPSAVTNWVGEVGWFDAVILVEALKTLGQNITRVGLMNAIDTMKPQGFGFTAPLQFSPGSHDMNKCVKFGRVTGGKVTPTTDWLCNNEPF